LRNISALPPWPPEIRGFQSVNIFYLFPRSGNAHALPLADTWRRNLLPALTSLGHQVYECYDPRLEELAGAPGEDPAFVAAAQGPLVEHVLRELKAVHRRQGIDLVLSYLWKPLFTAEGVREIRRLGIATINFFCNYFNGFDRIAELAPEFDCNWVADRGALPLYKSVGASAIFLPMAANPAIYRPYALGREYGVTFVGGKYGTRPEYVHHLLQDGVPVRVWGPGWLSPAHAGKGAREWRQLARRLWLLAMRPDARFLWGKLRQEWRARRRDRELAAIAGPPLDDEELVRMYSRSQVSLGFSTVGNSHLGSSPVTQLRLRDFEAPMSGALYLTEWSNGLDEMYEIDREIAVFRSAEELADKARFFLSHPAEAERMRCAGRERALRQHTWRQRLAELFEQVSALRVAS
jgi:spore maturation protein CgeB